MYVILLIESHLSTDAINGLLECLKQDKQLSELYISCIYYYYIIKTVCGFGDANCGKLAELMNVLSLSVLNLRCMNI